MTNSNKSLIHAIMGTLRKWMPGDSSGENQRAVRMFGQMLWLRELFDGRLFKKWVRKENWPVTSGSYIVGDQSATVAVCTLTSPELMEAISQISGVAIVARLVTVNLGIEKIIRNTISNPNIRFLLLCGKESPVFQPAQALQCLFTEGINDEHRIKKAAGHFPILKNIRSDQIEQFRQQVELINFTDELELKALRQQIIQLHQRKKPPFSQPVPAVQEHTKTPQEKQFKKIRPGGLRGTPTYDPRGFFIVTADREAGEIVLQHYQPDNTPAHRCHDSRAGP